MSADTLALLEAALHAHINDEGDRPWLVTGWVLSAAISSFETDQPGFHSYWFEGPDNQPSHVTRGLVSLADDWSHSTDIDFGDGDGS